MRQALGRSVSVALVALFAFAPAAHAGSSVTYQANAQHTGAVDDPLAPPLAVRWSWDLGAPTSYPIVADGRVFVTTAATQGYGSTLSALDAASGNLLWSRPLAHTYYWSDLAYDNGRLFALDYDGVLQAFDPVTGAALWGKQLPGQYSFSSAPVATGGVVYTGGAGSGGTVYAARESDGQVLWTAGVANGDDSSPSVANGHVYVSYACTQAYSFSTATGALDWHHSGPCEGGGGKTTVLDGNHLYTRDSGGPNLILDATSGAELGSFGSTVAPAFSAGVGLFMASSDLAAERTSDRVPLWSFSGDGSLSSAPFVVGSTVYEATAQGNLYALDRDSGAVVWSDCIGAPVPGPDEQNVSQPLTGLGAGDGLLVVPAGRYLVAYAAQPGAPSRLCDGTQTTPTTRFANGSTTTVPTQGPASATGTGSTVTLRASRGSIAYGQGVTLTGKANPGAQVELQSDPFPFGGFAAARSTTAALDGSFTFRVKPSRNTAYRAESGGAQSPAGIVYVDVAGRISAKRVSHGRVRVVARVVGPKDLPYARKLLSFYTYTTGRHVARRLGSERLHGRAGVFGAALLVRIKLTRRTHFAVCTRERTPDAWGRTVSADRTCGRTRIQLP